MIDENYFPAADYVLGYKHVKKKLKNVLCSVNFCGFCLETDCNLSSLEVPVICNTSSGIRVISLISLRNIVNEVFGYQIETLLSNYKICEKCKADAINAYNFIENSRQNSDILREYLRQIECTVNAVTDNVNASSDKTIIQLSDPVEGKDFKNFKTEAEIFDSHNNRIRNKDHDYTPLQKKAKISKDSNAGTHKIIKHESDVDVDDRPKKIHARSVPASRYTYIYYKCMLCNISIQSIEEVNKHIKCHKLADEDQVQIKKYYRYPKKGYKYLCEYCKKVCDGKREILEHKLICQMVKRGESNKNVRVTKPVFKYNCDVCNKTFCRKFQLLYHTDLAHNTDKGAIAKLLQNEKMFACPTCVIQDDCPHKEYLESYKAEILAGEWRVSCRDCNYLCWSKDALIAHVNKDHLQVYSIICEHCGKGLYSRQAYDRHINVMHRDINICEYCDREYYSKARFKSHQDKCKAGKREFQCAQCKASFSEEHKLKSHMKRHGDITYPCNLCPKVCYTVAAQKRHHLSHIEDKVTYNRRKDYACFKCIMTFPTVKDRNYHMQSHGPDEKYVCVKCKVSVDTLRELKAHRKKCPCEESTAAKFCCPFCKYRTHSELVLEGHLNRHHYKVAHYECHICHKKFFSQYTCNQHVKRHKKTLEWKCELCGRYLCTKGALQKHYRRHTKDKIYPCDLCEERFVCTSQRMKHKLKEHTGKNINCPLCDLTFYTVSNMRNHVKKIHWKFKDEKFDFTRLEGLTEEHYNLFVDRRMVVVENVEVVGKNAY